MRIAPDLRKARHLSPMRGLTEDMQLKSRDTAGHPPDRYESPCSADHGSLQATTREDFWSHAGRPLDSVRRLASPVASASYEDLAQPDWLPAMPRPSSVTQYATSSTSTNVPSIHESPFTVHQAMNGSIGLEPEPIVSAQGLDLASRHAESPLGVISRMSGIGERTWS